MPSLRFLIANKSLQSVVHSVRSAISLGSVSSRRNEDYTDIESLHTNSDTTKLYGQKSTPITTNVVGGVNEDLELHSLPQAGQIKVEHGMLQNREVA